MRIGIGRVAFIVAGVPAFYRFAITFDAVRDQLMLSPAVASTVQVQSAKHAGPASSWKQAAAEICTRLGHQAAIASQADPASPDKRPVQQQARALAFRLNTWAQASLQTDRLLLQLKTPRALLSKWRAGIASDQAGASLMLKFARAARAYRTEHSYQSAVKRFAARYAVAERTWSTISGQIGITACK